MWYEYFPLRNLTLYKDPSTKIAGTAAPSMTADFVSDVTRRGLAGTEELQMWVSGSMCKYQFNIWKAITRIIIVPELLIPNRCCWCRFYPNNYQSIHPDHGIVPKCPAKGAGGDRSCHWKAAASVSWRVTISKTLFWLGLRSDNLS